jgi:energy-coupling factor transport system permease protein
MTCFTAIIIVIASIPVSFIIKGLKPMMLIIIFTAFFNIFFIQGTHILFQYGFIKVTLEGIDMTVKLAIRLLLLVTGASVLTLTTSPIALTDGIESLLSPLKVIKVPAHEIAMMMSIALRFIPTLLEETDKIIKAQTSRGADFDSGNLINKAKSFIPVLVPLFVSAFRRAEELATAMEARCYRGSEGRTKLRVLKLKLLDYSIGAVMVVFCAGLILFERVNLY